MGENAADQLKEMAAQLAATLQVQGEKGREAWSQLHGKLAEVAAMACGDPTTALQALMKVTNDASSSPALEESVTKVNPHLLKDLVLLVADELSMTPLGESEPVHIIHGDSNFCEANVDHIIKCSAELSAPNPPYAVVSIVGAQSSGKSYLLNCLFGTKFPVMVGSRGRSQTTRGIMISRCIGPSLLLLDVEGFDGREKGQDKLFENQAALFALTVSDLMMVNMSVFDIGREQGGATQLFETIFKERTKLPRGFTNILVVLRLWDGETPLEFLRSDVLESLQKIWERVNLESIKFKDYIEVNVIGLPDKVSPEFPKEVKELRKRLSNITSAEVPASGFLLSSNMFWDTIKNNKELDIPSHQAAVARLYCRQLAEDILNSINSQEKYKILRAEESARRFKEISHEILETIRTEYSLKTIKYDPDARDQECQYLVARIHEIFKNDSKDIIWKASEKALDQFKPKFDAKKIKNMNEADATLYFEGIVDACIDTFMTSCEDVKVFNTDYVQMIYEELKNKLLSYAALAINVVISKLYCAQLVEDILKSINSLEKYKLLRVEDSARRFKEISHELLETITSEYNLKTKIYDDEVRDEECQYLVERIKEIFKNYSREIIRKVNEKALDQVKPEFEAKNIKKMNEADANLYFERRVDACIDTFMSSCEDVKVFNTDYVQMICEELKKKLLSYAGLAIKVAISKFYCPQLVEDILNSINSHEKYKLLRIEESARCFKEISHELQETIMTEYHVKTKMYDPYVRDQERQYLEERIHEIFKSESTEIIRKVNEKALEQFKPEFDVKKIKKMKEADANLYFERIVDQCTYTFMSSCEDVKVFNSDYVQMICAELKNKLLSYAALSIKAAVAKFYCGKIVEDILNSINFQEKCKILRAKESAGRFKEIAHELQETIMTEYNLKTKMYDSDISDQERQYLAEKIHEIFKNEAREIIWKFNEKVLEQFKPEFGPKKLKKMKDANANLYVERRVDASMDTFMSSCEDVKGFDFDYKRKCEDLKNTLHSYGALEIKAELARRERKKQDRAAARAQAMNTAKDVGKTVANVTVRTVRIAAGAAILVASSGTAIPVAAFVAAGPVPFD